MSTGTGSLADDSSRSETPTQNWIRRKKGKARANKAKVNFKCTNCLKVMNIYIILIAVGQSLVFVKYLLTSK